MAKTDSPTPDGTPVEQPPQSSPTDDQAVAQNETARSRPVRDWIDNRTGYRNFLHAVLLLNFPVSHATRWRYVWGGSLALLFFVQLVTGTLLMTVYSPSEAAAWGSVHYLETAVHWGWLIRGVHHCTSHMILVVMIVHLLVLVVTAGYRKPKEFTYWTGLLLSLLILGSAISGNPLPWDQKGYWAYTIETGIAGTMPVIGPSLKTLAVGGAEFGNLTLTRLYTLHVVVLPVLCVLLLTIHVALMRREKLITSRKAADGDGPKRTESYWPHQTIRNLLTFMLLMGLIVVQVVYQPRTNEKFFPEIPAGHWEPDIPIGEIALTAPADGDFPYVARPEWYVRFLFELRNMVPKEHEVLITGMLPAVVLLLLLFVPFYEKALGRVGGYAFSVLLVFGLVGGMGYLTCDGIQRDLQDEHFREQRRQELTYAGRAAWLASEQGIPPEGPATLLKNDPKVMGPILFSTHCASCHRWEGHDGMGKAVTEIVDGKRVPREPSASDLAGFGSSRWLTEFLKNPTGEKFFGHVGQLEGGEAIVEGEMANWATENSGPEGPLNEKHIEAIAAFVSQQAHLPNQPELDEATKKLARDIASGATLYNDQKEDLEFYGYCVQCHTFKAGDPNDEGSPGMAPDLTGYASKEWLTAFIRNPGAERFYGEKNVMPAFDAPQLSDSQLRLLVDWMRGEWPRNPKLAEK